MATMRLEILLSAVDRLSAPVAAARARLEALARPIQAVAAATARVASANGWRLLGASLQATTRGALTAASAMATLSTRAALLGGGAAVAGVAAFNAGFIGVASQFQRYRMTLETVMGSSEAAQGALDWVSEFARRTPYELAEVTQAFVAMRNLGLDPTRGSLEAAGNAAAVMGTGFGEATTAMAAALRGEFDSLERFGVFARVQGENVVMEWEHQGRRMRAVTDKTNREAIARYVQMAWNQKYGGAMDRLSASWAGMTSNLSDAWARFRLSIMENGVFTWLETRLQRVLDRINELDADGTLADWSRRIAAGMIQALEAIERFVLGTETTPSALQRMREAFEMVRGVIQPLLDRFGGLNVTLTALFLLLGGGTLITAVTGLATMAAGIAAFSLVLFATPAGWFLAAIAGIAAVVYLIYDSWGAIADWFESLWTRVRDGMAPQIAWLIEAAASIGAPLVAGITDAWNGLANVFAGVWRGITEPFVQMWDTVSPILRQVGLIQGASGTPGPEPAAGAPGARRMGRNGAQRIEGFDPPADPSAAGVFIGGAAAPANPSAAAVAALAAAQPQAVRLDAGGTLRILVDDNRVQVTGAPNDRRIGYDIGRGLSLATP